MPLRLCGGFFIFNERSKMTKFIEFLKIGLKKCFIKTDGSVALKRILATLLILSYIGVSIYKGCFENPASILTLLFTGV